MRESNQNEIGWAFPLESLIAFSSIAFGVLGVVAGRFAFGLDWVPSLLLFVPCHGLASGLANNESRRMVGSLFMLLIYPLAAAVASGLTAQLVSGAGNGGVRVTPAMAAAVGAFASALSFAAILLLSHLVAPVVGGWRLPADIHEVCVKAEVVIACTAALFLVMFALRMLSTWGLPVSPALRLVASVLAGLVFAFCIRGVLTTPLREESAAVRRKTRFASTARSAAPSVNPVTPPSVRLSDVAGMEEVKRQIRLRLIDPVRDAARARQYGIGVGGGMLLYGPPGTGKTFIAKAVAGELGLPFFAITAADVFGPHVGESEGNIRRIFAEIRNHPLSVVFIDELETIFPERSADVHETTRKVISLLLQELDGLDQTKNPILLLGATNVPWLIDGAFMRPGRFDVKVYVGLPDFAARRQMLIAAFDEGNVPHEPGLTARLAEKTEGYSGADLKGLMARMRQVAFDRRLPQYTAELADEIVAQSRPTTDAETVRRIREWGAQ